MLVNYLEIEFNPIHKFLPVDFFEVLNRSIPEKFTARREFMTVLLDNIQIYEERQANGQWLKSMEFKLPIIKEDMKLRLDNDSHVETVCLLSR